MDNKFVDVLEAYDFDTYHIARTRGAFLLNTNKGMKILKSFEGSEKKLLFEHKITDYLVENQFPNVDSLVKNKEEQLITRNSQGDGYIVKNWFLGEGFEPKDKKRAIESVICFAYF